MPAIINKDAEVKKIGPGKFTNTGLDKKDIVKRARALITEGSLWIPTWRELSTYVYPTKGAFHMPRPNRGSKIDHKTLLDSHGTKSVDIMGAGMLTGASSASRPWFKLGLLDLDLMEFAPVKIWLDDCVQILQDIFHKSNIYEMLHNVYKEIGVFGTACAALLEDFFKVIRARTFTAGEYCLATNANGKIDTFYRRYWMTAGQMAGRFGLENLSAQVQQKYQSNAPDQWNVVNHLIEVNSDRIPFLKDFRNMEYRSLYWEDSADNADSYLRIGGYEDFPMLTPRWDVTTSADTYGKGPGWKALGDIKGLQRMQKNKLIALDKQTDPPIQADASVVGEVNTLPGGLTRFSAQLPNAGVKPTYEVAINLADLQSTIQDAKSDIGSYFFTNLFQMIIEAEQQRREITATEIMEKQSEKLSLLAPVLEHLQDDLFNPLIERAFNIAQRAGLIPPPPAEIQDMELKIQYISILAQAQKMVGITAMDQWVGGIVNLAEVNPNIVDNINFDELSTEKADMLGVPAKIINSPERKAALRKAREDAAIQENAQKNALLLAEAAAKGGKAVKDMAGAPIGENSALDATLASLSSMRGNR